MDARYPTYPEKRLCQSANRSRKTRRQSPEYAGSGQQAVRKGKGEPIHLFVSHPSYSLPTDRLSSLHLYSHRPAPSRYEGPTNGYPERQRTSLYGLCLPTDVPHIESGSLTCLPTTRCEPAGPTGSHPSSALSWHPVQKQSFLPYGNLFPFHSDTRPTRWRHRRNAVSPAFPANPPAM